MNLTKRILTIGSSLTVAAMASATWYSSESFFTSNLNSNFYVEDFSGWTTGDPMDGTSSVWNAPGANGFFWDVSENDGLWSHNDSLSTNLSNTSLRFLFSGTPVTAFGARVANTDPSETYISGNATLYLSNGEQFTISQGAESGFIGWIGSSPIAWAKIGTTSSESDNWAEVDRVITGQTSPVPEPATIAALGLGAIALIRRRARKA